MTQYRFKVGEVSRGGYIAYDATDETTGLSIQLQSPMVVGSYPEIAAHLAQQHGLSVTLIYSTSLGDSFDQGRQTWTFVRGADEITVADMPRTVLRVTVSA